MKYEFRTWHAESLVVAVVLLTTVLVTHGTHIEWIGAAAVWCQFSHASIAERMAEQEAARPIPSVECYKKLGWYFTGKEFLWFWYFVLLGAWSALIGCALFVIYPLWRKWWRKHHPLPKVYQVLDPDLWERISSGERLFVSLGSTRHPFNNPEFLPEISPDEPGQTWTPPAPATPAVHKPIHPQSVLDYIQASNSASAENDDLQDNW